MSITVVKTPPAFTPLNGAIFQITSDRPTIIAFNIKVLDSDTAALITTQRYYTIPQTPTGTTFNLASLLAGVIGYQLDNSGTLLIETPKILKTVNVVANDVYLDVDGNQVVGADSTINQFTEFNALFSRYDYSRFSYFNWVGNATPLFQFLSTKPMTSHLYYDSTEFLYYMSSVPLTAEFKFYKKGVLVGTRSAPTGLAGRRGYRLNISPVVLGASFSDLYDDEFTAAFTAPFGSPSNINDVNYFTVRMKSASGYVTQPRIYILTASDCRKENLELIFGNYLGGFDSMFFTNPKQKSQVTRRSIELNPFQIGSDGLLSDHTADGVFNAEDLTIGVDIVNAYTCISEPLTDEMSKFAKGIGESKRVYARISTGELYPVQINETSIDVNKTRLNINNFRLTISFNVKGTSNIIFN